ncbi:c-type cytochrome [Variovorax sp. efr-133-TYG-130]|uniref:c-type cytochrome n=1 Tax=Variovorax sp. efr-133-TYG-130 TaxID=3040327 RepID=UPI0025535B83|nr:c-type cytochrome [Variovorax sp. efr-133-TYG-130]
MNRSSLSLALLGLMGSAHAQSEQALAQAKNCMACHSVQAKVVGPSFKDIAAKYKDDRGSMDQLAIKVLKGAGGTWGTVPMPANPQVSESEARRLATWILSLK